MENRGVTLRDHVIEPSQGVNQAMESEDEPPNLMRENRRLRLKWGKTVTYFAKEAGRPWAGV